MSLRIPIPRSCPPTLLLSKAPTRSSRSIAQTCASIKSDNRQHRHARSLSTTPFLGRQTTLPPRAAPNRPSPPKTTIAERGAVSKEDTQTDFGELDMLRSFAPPATAVDMCTPDGFRLNNGVDVRGGDGVLLVGGEGFLWRPWKAGGTDMVNGRGQFEVGQEGFGLLAAVWPKPDLIIVGTGGRLAPLAPATRQFLNGLGIRVEVQDTRNAAAQFNMLATERGPQQIAAAMVPIGWTGNT